MGLTIPSPDGGLLLAAVALDFVLGDPVYRWHPVRLMGGSIASGERWLRAFGADGHAGGCALVALLACLWVGGVWALHDALEAMHPVAGMVFHLISLYSFLALGDLLKHGDAVDSASEDLRAVRRSAGKLVGRDTDRMDAGACRRAAIESLAENLVDGFIAPVFWYAISGLPGLVLFKLVSTMDSMVGYKSDRYLRFGWCGARSDDLLNFVPARLAWVLIALAALLTPGGSGAKACRFGWRHHAVVPGPNPGWSEAAMAGAIQRRLAGPMWLQGVLVTDTWLGDPADAAASASADYRRARRIALLAASMAVVIAACWLLGTELQSAIAI